MKQAVHHASKLAASRSDNGLKTVTQQKGHSVPHKKAKLSKQAVLEDAIQKQMQRQAAKKARKNGKKTDRLRIYQAENVAQSRIYAGPTALHALQMKHGQ